MNSHIPTTIDEYIETFSVEVQKVLHCLRDEIRKAAPDATEKISYGMPAFFQEGVLVYFAAYAKHIGFYPTALGITTFAEELIPYKTSKGAVQFPLDSPIPYSLVRRMVTSRIRQNKNKAAEKKKGSKK
ncbi:MAG: hypothetical protein RIQ62_1750 [Bacteroidota bacterium]|jgi:uncharacterized protein YdhG (YjbR/CyaY superfamily)